MKYVLILAIIILVVRVDAWLGLVDRVSRKYGTESNEINTNDVQVDREVVGMANDPSLKQTTKGTFMALMEDFHSAPTAAIREKALSILKANPAMFGQTLDPLLESQIFRWRDLLNNNDPELVTFLLDLLNVLQAENQLMVKRFFSLWMEINMEHFIAAYSRSKDITCSIATIFGDNIPEEEKINEYYDREDALKAYLQKETIPPIQKDFATNCLAALNLEIAKRNSVAVPAPQVEPEGVSP